MRPLPLLVAVRRAAPDGAPWMPRNSRADRPMRPETPPNPPVAGGVPTIADAGDTPVCAAIAGDVAARVRAYGMAGEAGVTRRVEVAGRIVVSAGGRRGIVRGGDGGEVAPGFPAMMPGGIGATAGRASVLQGS